MGFYDFLNCEPDAALKNRSGGENMILDRKLQLELLEKMSSTYPDFYNFNHEYFEGAGGYAEVVANLYYLQQHNLIEERSTLRSNAMDGLKRLQIHLPTINQNGMDFLANDGGLSAILSTVTIKIDTEQFRQILLMKVSESNLPLDQKNQITSVLQELPAESIKHLSTKLLDLGWDNLGSLMQLIQNIPA